LNEAIQRLAFSVAIALDQVHGIEGIRIAEWLMNQQDYRSWTVPLSPQMPLHTGALKKSPGQWPSA
jgi:hypothetical protein